jgi:hypothetical protein
VPCGRALGGGLVFLGRDRRSYEAKDEKVLERILETYSTWLFQVISFEFSEYLWTG